MQVRSDTYRDRQEGSQATAIKRKLGRKEAHVFTGPRSLAANADLSISRDESGKGARRESFASSIDTMAETRLPSRIVVSLIIYYESLSKREIFIRRMIK